MYESRELATPAAALRTDLHHLSPLLSVLHSPFSLCCFSAKTRKKKKKKETYMHPFVILLAGYLLCGCKQAQRNRKDRSERKKEIYRKIKDIEETQGKKKKRKEKKMKR